MDNDGWITDPRALLTAKMFHAIQVGDEVKLRGKGDEVFVVVARHIDEYRIKPDDMPYYLRSVHGRAAYWTLSRDPVVAWRPKQKMCRRPTR